MIIRIVVCPSFEDGFGIEVNMLHDVFPTDSGMKVEFTEAKIKTKGFSPDVSAYLKDLESVFEPRTTEKEFEQKDCEKLLSIISNVSITPTLHPFASLDGSGICLEIESGDTCLSGRFNTDPPNGWTGVKELVQFGYELYEKYRKMK